MNLDQNGLSDKERQNILNSTPLFDGQVGDILYAVERDFMEKLAGGEQLAQFHNEKLFYEHTSQIKKGSNS